MLKKQLENVEFHLSQKIQFSEEDNQHANNLQYCLHGVLYKKTHTKRERKRERERERLTAYHHMYHIKIQNGGHVRPEDKEISMSCGIHQY